MGVLRNAGIMALATMFVSVLPLAMGIVYALWPTELRLTMVRTLSLAGLCSSICGTTLGFINELIYITRKSPESFSPVVAPGLAESLVPLFVGLGCLTVAWLCVTIGLWRRAASAT
jgi:hypothetical protein